MTNQLKKDAKRVYLPLKVKYTLAFVAALIWTAFSLYIAVPWILQLSALTTIYVAILIIFGIAIIPGFMNAFLITSLLLDNRPARKNIKDKDYPAITLLITTFNEADNITATIESISRQEYPGKLHVIIADHGSTDNTVDKVKEAIAQYPWLSILNIKRNCGKVKALNKALEYVKTDLVLTAGSNSYLYKDALKFIVERFLSDPPDTAAIAGAVMVRNSRRNLITRIQEWDYFHGIAAVKRLQSMYHGTLVAQGAFSLFKTDVLKSVGGWPECTGEDMVLTWAILNKGYRVGYAEDACLFINAPETWSQFFRQRLEQSCGLINAFKLHWHILFKTKMITLIVWWNLLFPYMDLIYAFVLIPGVVLAFMGYFWIAGLITLIVMPLAMAVNYVMFNIQSRMFESQGLTVRTNIIGFILYSVFYNFILQPASVLGYIKEFFNKK